MEESVLQTILGTDIRNPVLSLCREKNTDKLYVYYGAQLLEVVPDNPDHISYKAIVGRLFNAGLNRDILRQTFNVSFKTMQNWGKALLIDDPEKAVQILNGRDNYLKLTPDIQSFIKRIFNSIYEQNRYSYSQTIRDEIKDKFDKTLSAETIRPLLKICKKGFLHKKELEKKMEKDCESNKEAKGIPPVKGVVNKVDRENTQKAVNRKSTPILQSPEAAGAQYLHYAGLYIFSNFISLLSNFDRQTNLLLKQWFSFFLLEVVNIEQSKYIDHKSLKFILGNTIPNPKTQRDLLSQIASDDLRLKILSLNKHVIDINNVTDFYYDPHTKHYTGVEKILKGWCPSVNGISKVLHCDYIHTKDGMPVFVSYNDNFYDLRDEERYLKTINSMISCYTISKKITLVFDRGIYGIKTFLAIEQNPNLELITWEKDYKSKSDIIKKDEWKKFSLTRYRNNSHDTQKYDFEYYKEYFDKDKKVIRIIVRAKNPKGRLIEVSVIATDKSRDPVEIITMIFNRWIQENSFKYLITHLGINQIISYAKTDYKQLQKDIKDRDMLNGKYKAVTSLKAKVTSKIEKLLFKQHLLFKNKQELIQLKAEIVNLKKQKNYSKSILKELQKKCSALKSKIKKWQEKDFELQIEQHSKELDELIEEHKNIKKNISRLSYCIENDYKCLNTEKKSLLDALKIFAHNCYWYYFRPFRKLYNNFRDDHAYFRNIIQSDGTVEEEKDSLAVTLKPEAHLAPKLQIVIDNVLTEINKNDLRMPDGSNRKIALTLNQEIGLEIAI
ncbi:MAG: hypothetical protein GY834_17220 [Bacteroidetes bacterium]|nr:hypothetical protein [Bacteroidota bacterium]